MPHAAAGYDGSIDGEGNEDVAQLAYSGSASSVAV